MVGSLGRNNDQCWELIFIFTQDGHFILLAPYQPWEMEALFLPSSDEILFVIYADCQWCLFQEIKQTCLPPISVIKHLHMLLKHTLTQRNGQQNKLGNSSSTTYTSTCKPLKNSPLVNFMFWCWDFKLRIS